MHAPILCVHLAKIGTVLIPCMLRCLAVACFFQVVQYLTVDYGKEFCDYYGARCNRQMIETCRVKAVGEVPSSVKMDWVEHKVPIPPKGHQEAAAAASPAKAVAAKPEATAALPSFF